MLLLIIPEKAEFSTKYAQRAFKMSPIKSKGDAVSQFAHVREFEFCYIIYIIVVIGFKKGCAVLTGFVGEFFFKGENVAVFFQIGGSSQSQT